MSDGSRHAAKLRERLTNGTEDKLGKALADLIENPLITGTIGRAFDARERAAQAQELALSALNIPTAADIERLTRRLRSVSQRLEGIEDGVHRINRALTEGSVERRLSAMEDQLRTLSSKLTAKPPATSASPASASAAASTASSSAKASSAKAPAKAKASTVKAKTPTMAKSSTAKTATRGTAGATPKRPSRAPRAKKSA
jgi:uncharacterized coiled-coil protein SlyX